MKFKKNLIGGDQTNPYKQIQLFISIIIIGYFGVKIVYGIFFGFYPQKYYYRDVQINTTEGSSNTTSEENSIPITTNVTIDAYMPGMWNNETTDLITTIVLAFVVFVFTSFSEKSMINEFGNVNFSFLFGYIIGLGYPPIYNNYINLFNKEINSSCTIRYIYLVCLIGLILFVILMNYSASKKIESSHSYNYLIYVTVINLIIVGLFFSKKNSKNYNAVTYSYVDENSCRTKNNISNSIIQSSGDLINITAPFLCFILLLFYSYEPKEIGMKNLYIFTYGMFLGILVSSISYYGIEFFLIRKPEMQCDNINDCQLSDYVPVSENNNSQVGLITDSNIIKKNMNLSNMKFVSIFKLIILVLIILISIYLIFRYMKKNE